MLNSKQLRTVIIRPVLDFLSLYSSSAEELLVAICAHESLGVTYLMQQGCGAAYGPWQMQQLTHNDIWANVLKGSQGKLIMDSCNVSTANAALMAFNLKYACAMARVFFTRFSEPLPPSNDINAIAVYWKKYWNTDQGAGTVDEFIQHYRQFVG